MNLPAIRKTLKKEWIRFENDSDAFFMDPCDFGVFKMIDAMKSRRSRLEANDLYLLAEWDAWLRDEDKMMPTGELHEAFAAWIEGLDIHHPN